MGPPMGPRPNPDGTETRMNTGLATDWEVMIEYVTRSPGGLLRAMRAATARRSGRT
jgi:hypothetical protein